MDHFRIGSCEFVGYAWGRKPTKNLEYPSVSNPNSSSDSDWDCYWDWILTLDYSKLTLSTLKLRMKQNW